MPACPVQIKKMRNNPYFTGKTGKIMEEQPSLFGYGMRENWETTRTFTATNGNNPEEQPFLFG